MGNAKIRSYSDFIVALENLADGIKTHFADTEFPVTLKEDQIRQLRTQLEDSRAIYEASINAARIKHDEYESIFSEAINIAAKSASMLYGFYGKKNQILADFGLLPHKTRSRKKVSAAATPKPASV